MPQPIVRPSPARVGLVEDGPRAVRERLAVSWDAFLSQARQVDLDAPSRLPDWAARDILAHLGTWNDHHPLEATVESARSDRAGVPLDQDAADARVTARHRDESRRTLLEALEGAREHTLSWLQSEEAAALATSQAATVVGALPLLTAVQCLAFELAVHGMDLEWSGADRTDAALVDAGLTAICDATAGVAYRQSTYASVKVQTPRGGWRMVIDEEGWTTTKLLPGKIKGTGVTGDPRDLLDVASGRANVVRLYTAGRVQVSNLTGFLELAPLVEHMPGIPNQAALASAAMKLRRVNRMLGRRPAAD